MTLTSKPLAGGVLSTSTSPIYEPVNPALGGVVKFFTLMNGHDAYPVTVNVFVERGGQDRRICPKNLILDPGDTLVVLEESEEIGLRRDTRIKADASISDVVEYYLGGDEET